MVVDTHLHIWQRARSGYAWLNLAPALLQNNFNLAQLEEERKLAGVTAGVLVQADDTLADTGVMLEAAHNWDWIKGVVGWLPLKYPEKTAGLLDQFVAKNQYFKGVRHLIHNEPDDQWLLQPQVVESLQLIAARQLPFDLVGTTTSHVKTALRLAEKVPGLVMVFDHLNQPPIKSGEHFGEWGLLMREVAACKRFHMKISGLGAVAGTACFTDQCLKPYIEFVLEVFGPHRCFCGSDWPLSLIEKGYVATWDIYKQVLCDILGDTEPYRSVLGANAVNFYKL